MKVKSIDHLGRIVIPKVFRTELGLTEGTPIRFRSDPESGALIIRKADDNCAICHSDRKLIKIKDDVYLCAVCLKKISKAFEK